MRRSTLGTPSRAAHFILLAAATSASMIAQPATTRAAEPTVLGVVAVDGYADLKKQLGWLGGQIGQPGLAAMAESLLLVATQGRGLRGLDVGRPLGVIVTTDGTMPIVHGYVPVKNLDDLLASLQAVIGPVEQDGNVRRVSLPSGATIDFTEQAGPSGAWGVAALPGSPAGVADPLPHVESVAGDVSIGIRAFPSLMPDAIRKQLEALLDQAAAAAAAQGQQVDVPAIRSFITSLAATESFGVGVAIDPLEKQAFAEIRSTQVAGSLAAKQMAAADKGTLTVGLPTVANGARPALRGHVAQIIPADLQPQILQSLDATLEQQTSDPIAASVGRVARSLLAAMLGSGSLEAAMTVDTSSATDASPLPAVTAGARIQDGKAFEAEVKKLLGPGNSLPPNVRVAFDTGTAQGATLHTLTLDLDGTPAEEQLGASLDLTLAIAPEYAFVLSGGDAKRRVAEAVAASGKPDAAAKPIAGLQAAVDGLFAFVADRSEGEEADRARQAAAAAREAGGGLVQLTVKPIERGTAVRLSIDDAALQAGAALSGRQQEPGAVLPPGVPLPEGFPIPLPVR